MSFDGIELKIFIQVELLLWKLIVQWNNGT